jgi:hypothetical protein
MVCNPVGDFEERHAREQNCTALCSVDYPYKVIGKTEIQAVCPTGDCTRGKRLFKSNPYSQVLGYEDKMTLISRDELSALIPPATIFASGVRVEFMEKTTALRAYQDEPHFCVDGGRRTVDGHRLQWMWIYKDGVPAADKKLGITSNCFWSKAEVLGAWDAALVDRTVPLAAFTRHTELLSELAITFCLPFPEPILTKTQKKQLLRKYKSAFGKHADEDMLLRGAALAAKLEE